MNKTNFEPNQDKVFGEMKIDNGELNNAIQNAKMNRKNQKNKPESDYNYFVSYNKGADMVDIQ